MSLGVSGTGSIQL